MVRTRLTEGQFTAITSGYLALMTATEAEKHIRNNVTQLLKNWDSDPKPISRNSINKIFNKLDERISALVEGGLLNGFPYGTDNTSPFEEREAVINEVISQIYLLLTDKISKKQVKHLHDIWRGQGQGFLFDSPVWQCTEIMWKKMSGLEHDALRRMFNRVALIYYVCDAYKETSVVDASNASLAFVLDHLKNNPLE